MKKRILDYKEKIDRILDKPDKIVDVETLKKEHLIQIGFFMHERLVHLIVTITFALLTIIGLGLIFVINNIAMIVLFMLFVCLLVPYIMHYYLLENSVQYMYEQYDRMCALRNKVLVSENAEHI